LQVVTRRRGERRMWFLLNTARERLELEIRSGQALAEVSLEGDCPPGLARAGGAYRRTVWPFESILLEEIPEETAAATHTAGAGGATPAEGEPPQQLTIGFSGPVKVVPHNPNLLRLYH